ncbi:hypothetical protein Bhyg_04297, partial [Pseudolycoriella hygida]
MFYAVYYIIEIRSLRGPNKIGVTPPRFWPRHQCRTECSGKTFGKFKNLRNKQELVLYFQSTDVPIAEYRQEGDLSDYESDWKALVEAFRSKLRCFECNQYGHKASACVKKNPNKKSPAMKPETSTTSQNSRKGTVFSAFASGGLRDRDNWYVDSGASAHFTMRDDWMETQQPPSIREIIVANDAKLSVKASGKVKMNVNCGGDGDSNEISINNVQHVPDITANLLSVSQLVLKGFSVTFDTSECRIMDRAGNVCATEKMVNNVFKLNVIANKNQVVLNLEGDSQNPISVTQDVSGDTDAAEANRPSQPNPSVSTNPLNQSSLSETDDEMYLTDEASDVEVETTVIPNPTLRRSERQSKPVDRLV